MDSADDFVHAVASPKDAASVASVVSNHAEGSRKRRKRISVACRACRMRKSRNKNRMLEQRLLAIEQRLQAFEDHRDARPPAQDHAGNSATTASTLSVDGLSVATTQQHTPFQSQDTVDGMGSVFLRDGTDDDEFFGCSSNVSFLRFVVRALGRPVTVVERTSPSTPDPSHEPFDEDGLAFFRRNGPVEIAGEARYDQDEEAVDPFALPPHETSEHLLRLYFATVNLMIPCIHEDTFRAMKRQALPASNLAVSRHWLGLLNMVFAIANNAQTPTSPSAQCVTQSDIFFKRAMALIRPNMLGRVSLELLQVFLLMVIYLEGTPSSSMAWTFHSLAVKGCYQLGLPSIGSRSLSPLDQEICKRLWSITHIVGETVERLYDQNLGSRPSPITSTILDEIAHLCWKLAKWQDSLHPVLRIIASGDSIPDMSGTLETKRLCTLLSLRYLGTRILVLRPVLVYFLDPPAALAKTEHQAKWLCKSAAILLADLSRTCGNVLHIINSILTASHNDLNLLGAWWFSTYYTFNASLAVFGILLAKRMPAFSTDLEAISVSELRSLLGLAKDILHGLNNGNKTITRCSSMLSGLLAQLDAGSMPAVDGPGYGQVAPSSFSPSSAWSYQMMDPVLFASDLSFGIGSGLVNYDTNITCAFETHIDPT
ncbi:hypothetical protein SBRCBS47491_002367 [Sporothrix bragantina]|uniref:Xylanolytic transcriptional activator regulatory domain-containing protein n=1 Tax=Sporothrix bragantina TaxID=671064 RepID=A0ABP0B6H5_9PEZI